MTQARLIGPRLAIAQTAWPAASNGAIKTRASPRASIQTVFHQPMAFRIAPGSRPAETNASITGQKNAARNDMAPATAKSTTGESEIRIAGQISTCRRKTSATTVRGAMREESRRRMGALAKAEMA